MAFRDHELSSEVRHAPRAAVKKIFDAYERAGFNLEAAAKELGITARTLSRHVTTLGIDERIRKARRAFRAKTAASA